MGHRFYPLLAKLLLHFVQCTDCTVQVLRGILRPSLLMAPIRKITNMKSKLGGGRKSRTLQEAVKLERANLATKRKGKSMGRPLGQTPQGMGVCVGKIRGTSQQMRVRKETPQKTAKIWRKAGS